MTRFALIFMSFLILLVFAQDLGAEDVLNNLSERAKSLQDAQFLLTGLLIDADGTELPLEINVQLIPPAQVARAEFIQPDALADNFIVLDGDSVYNYIYLTNQATVFKAGDPDALGGLFPESNSEESFQFSLDLEALFASWQIGLEGYEESPAGNVYKLRFDNLEEGAVISYVRASVLAEAWLPYTMTFYNADDTILADLKFDGIKTDIGLNADDLRYIPDDAEIIDER